MISVEIVGSQMTPSSSQKAYQNTTSILAVVIARLRYYWRGTRASDNFQHGQYQLTMAHSTLRFVQEVWPADRVVFMSAVDADNPMGDRMKVGLCFLVQQPTPLEIVLP